MTEAARKDDPIHGATFYIINKHYGTAVMIAEDAEAQDLVCSYEWEGATKGYKVNRSGPPWVVEPAPGTHNCYM
ncbi:hypothetical protein FRC07_005616 [Ceratobasidium sp. 392]|nr:hypothetical protein FRC07_005616 [Ceratobasidium sp. 392]